MDYVELIGYVAMTCVGISIAMKKVKLLRIWNLLGAIAFVVYGILISSNPVIILNAILTVINIYYLIQIFGSKQELEA